MEFSYIRSPLHSFTFKSQSIRKWVEKQCEGTVLNLFAGMIKLDYPKEIRNDIREDMPADYHKDALQFLKEWNGEKFNTIILDPPYSSRKSMEYYDGKLMSPFNAMKNEIPRILAHNGKVITFGYHSNVMGKTRGFIQEHLLIISSGGAIHDTLVIVERFIEKK